MLFISLSLSLTSAFLPNELNEIDVSFTTLEPNHSNRKGKCKFIVIWLHDVLFLPMYFGFIPFRFHANAFFFWNRICFVFCVQIEKLLCLILVIHLGKSTKQNSINNFCSFFQHSTSFRFFLFHFNFGSRIVLIKQSWLAQSLEFIMTFSLFTTL